MNNVYLDIETNTAHDTIWCCVTVDGEGEVRTWTSAHEYIDDEGNAHGNLKGYLTCHDKVIGHNIVTFDAPVLADVWDVTIPHDKLLDTLICSRLFCPEIGGHSLGDWGGRLGHPKISFDDYDGGLTDEMIEYCIQDTKILPELFTELKTKHSRGFSKESVQLEHDVAAIIGRQMRHGFMLDIEKATWLYETCTQQMNEIEETLQDIFPPITHRRFSEKTGKELKPFIETFNVGSRQQIGKRLQSLGVVFKEKTPTGHPVINEKVLEGIDLPEAGLVHIYLTLQKRAGQADSWLQHVKEDGRVRGYVNSTGTITGRMTHSRPNVAQVPSSHAPYYGKECRECWTVPKGKVLVGADASGLELRMLAHHMDDEEYTEEVVNGDVHTKNQIAAGLDTRDNAKTFIYAFLYGAGDAKIGSIVGGTSKVGKKLKQDFLEATPALKRVRARIQMQSERGWLRGLDGRKIFVRSKHAALNTQLQGDGAILMKKALVILDSWLRQHFSPEQYSFVANVHDEWQIECDEKIADLVGKFAVEAIEKAGEELQLNCPVTGEYKVGRTWAETH